MIILFQEDKAIVKTKPCGSVKAYRSWDVICRHDMIGISNLLITWGTAFLVTKCYLERVSQPNYICHYAITLPNYIFGLA